MRHPKRLTLVFALSGALVNLPVLAQQRDLPRQPPSEPMPGMTRGPGTMEMPRHLRADLRLERIRTIAEGRAALGAEQRTKLDQLAAESSRGMMGSGGGRRGGSSRPQPKL